MRPAAPSLTLTLLATFATACAFDASGGERPAVDPFAGKGDDAAESIGDCERWSDLLPVGAGTRLLASVDECGPITRAELAAIDETHATIRLEFGPNAGDWAAGHASLEHQEWTLSNADGPGLCGGARINLSARLSSGRRSTTVPLVLQGIVRTRTDSDVVEVDFPGSSMRIRRDPHGDRFEVTFQASADTAAALGAAPPAGYGLRSTCGVASSGAISKTFHYRYDRDPAN